MVNTALKATVNTSKLESS